MYKEKKGAEKRVFPVWARVSLGGYDSAETCLAELRDVSVLCWVRDVADKILMSSQSELDLVRVTVGELGFTEPAPVGSIFIRAQDLGLALVPQDAALYAAHQVGDRVTCKENALFAMPTVITSDGARMLQILFCLIRFPHGELELSAAFVSHETRLLGLDYSLVFALA